MKRIKLTAAMVFELVLVAVIVVFIGASLDLPLRTRRLPLIVAWITLAFVAWDLGAAVWKQARGGQGRKGEGLTRAEALKTLGSGGFMLATILFWNVLGFLVTSVLLTFGFTMFLGAKNKVAAAITSLVLPVAVYVVFAVVLRIPLPRGVLL